MQLLKKHSLAEVEAVIAKALNELAGSNPDDHVQVSLNNLQFNELLSSASCSMQISGVMSEFLRGAV
jgi:hypothetical protein